MEVGISVRTVARWRANPAGEDRRQGPKKKPRNALSKAERQRILETVNRRDLRDRTPHQIVAILADAGEYIGSESTIYRVLRAEKQLAHRGRSKPRTPRPVPSHEAAGPRQLWSWDITYLPTVVRGRFFYLYMFMDVWSRKVVGWDVHEREDDACSASLLQRIEDDSGSLDGVVVHADNGGPMRGSTMVAKMEALGVLPSFSRPRVSNDNPFSESLFRTMKYVPMWPDRPFESPAEAGAWVAKFVAWYNDEHRHSGLDYLTPSERHAGQSATIFRRRRAVYEAARRAHPDRWSGDTRSWDLDAIVRLNRPPARRRKEGESREAA